MNKTIVIVDDFVTNTAVFSTLLQNQGFKIITSNSPIEAILIFNGQKIDLLVSDFKMPGMNGAEFVRKVKQIPQYRNMPVLMLSSETGEKSKQEARAAGAYGWLVKPFKVQRFLKIVTKIFA